MTPLSNDTIDFVLRQREVGRAKDLSAPPRNCLTLSVTVCWQYHHCMVATARFEHGNLNEDWTATTLHSSARCHWLRHTHAVHGGLNCGAVYVCVCEWVSESVSAVCFGVIWRHLSRWSDRTAPNFAANIRYLQLICERDLKQLS